MLSRKFFRLPRPSCYYHITIFWQRKPPSENARDSISIAVKECVTIDRSGNDAEESIRQAANIILILDKYEEKVFLLFLR